MNVPGRNDAIDDCLIGRPGLLPGGAMDDKSKSDKRGERIAKVIARAGLASRREAEQWIAAGRVAVNGTIIGSPALNVAPGDQVSIDGEPLPQRERTRLFLYHKPRGVLTSHGDPQGRPTIFQRLPKNLPRLISVGRLDFNTEGLLLLTNDGALARVLELPATGWLRRYRVRAHGSLTQAQLDTLRQGITVKGIHYGPIEAELERVQGSNLWLTFAIREGKNREVRTVLDSLGLSVARLIRVSFGPFQLGELAEGEVEEIRTRVLREQLGEHVAALAGLEFSAPRRDVAREASPRPLANQAPNHVWRAPDDEKPANKLRRKFRGSRRNKPTSKEPPPGSGRAETLTDRKGRSVPVERHGNAKPAPPAEPRITERPHKHRRRRSDRAGGPRPARPKGR
ncbi:MAG: rRNA pseudouridine synthase [Hyphomicrobiales bacterium]|nr:rRNA pseudouridine synthase [Hyphomicrobiales bacterium]